jgi:hypothetical protein
MKKASLIIATVLALATFALGQDERSNSSKVSSRGSASGNGDALVSTGNKSINAGTALQGQLQNTVDVRRSKVGDQVVLKTIRDVKQNGQTVVPKGSQLVGRITEISQRSKTQGESRIGMVFDRIQGRSLSEPISTSITSITSVSSAASLGNDLFDSDISGSSSSSGSVRRGSSTSGGGGLLGGGSTGGLLSGATSTLGGVTSTATNTLGGATNTVGGITNGAGQTLGNTTRGVGSTVNGLRISGGASGSADGSTTISSGKKDLQIEKGATFNVLVNN